MLAALMAWYGVQPDARLLALPLFIAQCALLALGLGLLLAALTVTYRDFRYVVPFIDSARAVRLAGRVRDRAGAGALARALCAQSAGRHHRRIPLVAAWRPRSIRAVVSSSIVVTLLSLAAGVWYFRRTERGFADVI